MQDVVTGLLRIEKPRFDGSENVKSWDWSGLVWSVDSICDGKYFEA
jgi:hypothetical protein